MPAALAVDKEPMTIEDILCLMFNSIERRLHEGTEPHTIDKRFATAIKQQGPASFSYTGLTIPPLTDRVRLKLHSFPLITQELDKLAKLAKEGKVDHWRCPCGFLVDDLAYDLIRFEPTCQCGRKWGDFIPVRKPLMTQEGA